jgi:hypothetical protein
MTAINDCSQVARNIIGAGKIVYRAISSVASRGHVGDEGFQDNTAKRGGYNNIRGSHVTTIPGFSLCISGVTPSAAGEVLLVPLLTPAPWGQKLPYQSCFSKTIQGFHKALKSSA